MKIISLAERKRQLRQEMEANRSPREQGMDRQIQRLVEALDDLDERLELLEARQLQLVRALNELLTRLEQEGQ